MTIEAELVKVGTVEFKLPHRLDGVTRIVVYASSKGDVTVFAYTRAGSYSMSGVLMVPPDDQALDAADD